MYCDEEVQCAVSLATGLQAMWEKRKLQRPLKQENETRLTGSCKQKSSRDVLKGSDLNIT